MTFPATPLGIKTELNINGAWTDVTTQTYSRDGYTITRGRRSEGSTADVSTCTMTFNNRTGNFSPRNPVGAYYGYIGRNTPVRVSVPATSSWLQLQGTVGDCASAPDAARLDITGDIDVRVDAWLPTWRNPQDMAGKYIATGNQRSWQFYVDLNGVLVFAWSPDGTSTARISVPSTVPVPAPIIGRKAVRATLQVNNGLGGYTVTFYISDTIAGTWTQLGDAVVTTAGTTSIFNSTASLYAGDIAGGNGGVVFDGNPGWSRFYALQVLNGISGTAAANPDFTAQTDGTTSFADAAGNTWTVGGAAQIRKVLYRFNGEISEWPPSRDISDKDRVVQVTASGILRRLGRGTKPLKSAYYRGCTSTVAPVTGLVGYWSCEDAAGATSIASGLSGASPMAISGTPVLATDSTNFVCSDALPTMGSASFTGSVPSYTSTGQIQLKVLLAIPSTGITDGAVLLRLRCGGTAVRWEVVYNTASGGNLTLNAYDAGGNSLMSSTISFAYTGSARRLAVSMAQSGADVAWVISTLVPGSSTGSQLSGTLTSNTVTVATQISIAPNADCAGMTAGHITVQSVATSVFDLANLLNAYSGELVSTRMFRLCAEENVPFAYMGARPTEITMGYQTRKTLLDLLRECETADNGILYEPRDFLGLAYRSGQSLMTQAAAVTLNYAAADLSMPFAPTEDDRYLTNDVTVTRNSGSSARYVDSTSPLSTQAPPAGVGVYDSTVTLANALDTDLPGQASWRVHLGTVNEPRFPNIAVQLARSNFTGSATKTAGAQAVDVGDRLVITNPPSDLPPDNINQLAIGMVETLNTFVWDISWVGQPEDPYHVPTYTDGTSRYASGTSTLNGAHNSTTTSLSVATTGALWGHGDGNYDILVGGERMTVTAVSGTSSPQTLTVTRSVNGIVKSHSSGETVELFNVLYYAL